MLPILMWLFWVVLSVTSSLGPLRVCRTQLSSCGGQEQVARTSHHHTAAEACTPKSLQFIVDELQPSPLKCCGIELLLIGW
jgi:hypothetical protein